MAQLIFLTTIIIVFWLERHFSTKADLIAPIMSYIYLVILMGGQTSNPDYYIYSNIYNSTFYYKDPGFGLLLQFFKLLGFNQNNYRIMVAIVGLGLISYTAFRFLNNRTLFFILYGIYPFMFDVVQLRNFLVMSIVVFSIPLLIDNKKKNKMIYILCIIIASTIQKVALVYLPLVIVNEFKEKASSKFLSRIIIVLTILIALNRSALTKIISIIVIPFTNSIPEIVNYQDINTHFGWIIFWMEQICMYVLMTYALRIEKREHSANKNPGAECIIQLRFVELMKNVNYFMFVFLPLFVLNENYTRIIRNIIPLNIIAIIAVLSKHRKKIYLTKPRLFLLSGIIIYQVILIYLLSRSYSDSILRTTLFENWIWNSI